MLRFERWKVVLCVLAILFGAVFSLPNAIPNLPSFLPQQRLNLGLDLQGGSYLLLEVDIASLKAEKLTNLVEDTRTTLQSKQIVFSGLALNGDGVSVRITDPTQVQAAYSALQSLALPVPGTVVRDVAISTGPDQTLHLTIPDQAMVKASADAVTQDIEIVRRRIDLLGTREPQITQQGTDRIVVEAPGESDPERLKAVIGQTAKLTFQMVDQSVSAQDAANNQVPPDDEVLPDTERGGQPTVVKRRAVVSGEMLTGAQQSTDQNGRPSIAFRFNGIGAKRFGDATMENVGKPFAIVIDNKILSAPTIQGPILGGSGEITGSFTVESANNLALMLRSGALPAKLNTIEQRTVGAELGAELGAGGRTGRGHRHRPDRRLHDPGLRLHLRRHFRALPDQQHVHGDRRHDRGRRDPDPAGHRRPDPDHRHGGGRQCADLRADPRRGAGRAPARHRHRHRL